MNFKTTLFLFLLCAIQAVAQTVQLPTVQLPINPNRYAGSNNIVSLGNDAFTYSSIVLPPSIFGPGFGRRDNVTSVSLKNGVVWSNDYRYTKTSFVQHLTAFQGGYLMSGGAFDKDQNKMLSRLDATGNVVWSKRYGATNDTDTLNSIVTQALPLADGNIAFAGGAGNFASDLKQNDLFLAKIDANGGQIWAKRYCFSCSGNNETVFKHISTTADGGFLICGTLQASTFAERILLIKTNALGAVEWVRTYHDASLESEKGVQTLVLPNGNYALLANQKGIASANNAGILAEISPAGAFIRAMRIRVAPYSDYFTLQMNKAVNEGNDAFVISAGVTQDSTPNASIEQNLLFKIKWNGVFDWKYNHYDETVQGFVTATSDLAARPNGGFWHLTNFAVAQDELYPIIVATDSQGKNEGCEKQISMKTEMNVQLTTTNITVITQDVTAAPTNYPITKETFALPALILPKLALGKDTSLCATPQIVLDATGANIDSYTWSTGATTPRITVSTAGQYSVKITNAAFCFAIQDTVIVTKNCNNPPVVDPIPAVSPALPNAFTPNSGNANDVFEPLGSGFTINTFQIFNRWGQQVFEGSETNRAWSGNFKGSPAPSTVYYYILKYTVNGVETAKKGSVTLIR
jgi:gliding motility-associated-like protein